MKKIQKNFLRLILLLILTMGFSFCFSTKAYAIEIESNKLNGIEYYEFVPNNFCETTPIIFAFHGAGSSKEELDSNIFGLYKKLQEEPIDAKIIFPKKSSGSWSSQIYSSFIDSYMSKNKTNGKIYYYGFSMGSIDGLRIIKNCETYFDAAILIDGAFINAIGNTDDVASLPNLNKIYAINGFYGDTSISLDLLKEKMEAQEKNLEYLQFELTHEQINQEATNIMLEILTKNSIINFTNALAWNLKPDIKIPIGEPITIKKELEDSFEVIYNKKTYTIEKEFCMVNLPDVMPKETIFDITNAYQNNMTINNKKVDGISNEILYPYAYVGENEFLVPILAPVAKKLFEAEKDLYNLGYTLKIYDAYRPKTINTYVYEKVCTYLLNNKNEKEEMLLKRSKDNIAFEYLIPQVSNHNYGVAIDVTLVDLETKEEIPMQSKIYEYSTLSITALNTYEANILKEVMLLNGFTNSSTKWWHFEMREYKDIYYSFPIKASNEENGKRISSIENNLTNATYCP